LLSSPRPDQTRCQVRADDTKLEEGSVGTKLERKDTESWREEAQKAAEKVWSKAGDEGVKAFGEEQRTTEKALVDSDHQALTPSSKHRRRGHTDPVPKDERAEVDPQGAHDPNRVGPWALALSEAKHAISIEEFCNNVKKPVIVKKDKYRPRLPGVLKAFHDGSHENWDFGTCSLYSLELCYATCGMTVQSCREEYHQCMKAACSKAGVSLAMGKQYQACVADAQRHAQDSELYGGAAFTQAQEEACTCVAPQDMLTVRRHALGLFYMQWDPLKQSMVERILPVTHDEDKFARITLKLHQKYNTLVESASSAFRGWVVAAADPVKMEKDSGFKPGEEDKDKTEERTEKVKSMMFSKLENFGLPSDARIAEEKREKKKESPDQQMFNDVEGIDGFGASTNNDRSSEPLHGTSDHVHRPHESAAQARSTVSTCPPACFGYTCDHWKHLGTHTCAFLRPRCNNCEGCGACGTPESEKDDPVVQAHNERIAVENGAAQKAPMVEQPKPADATERKPGDDAPASSDGTAEKTASGGNDVEEEGGTKSWREEAQKAAEKVWSKDEGEGVKAPPTDDGDEDDGKDGQEVLTEEDGGAPEEEEDLEDGEPRAPFVTPDDL